MKTVCRRSASPCLAVNVLLLTLFLTGCSDDSTGVDKELAPLVGEWRATALVLTSAANPDLNVDLIDMGATFTLSVLGNGQYTAYLSAFQQSNTEIGRIEVSGSQVTISPTTPPGPSIVGTFEFQGSVLVLDGETEYDFNQDGISESALVHMELEPVDS